MKVIGIIAEYNPFHNGHAYQIEEIRKKTGADYIVVAMSGDFVQRGAPAIIDKYARTRMALSCGADLIIELPVLWATASAEHFAMAGITMFEKMGCVDGICFGAETGNLTLLSRLAEILAQEPTYYKKALSSYIKDGLTFPAARARALCKYLTACKNEKNGSGCTAQDAKAATISDQCSISDHYSTEDILSVIDEPNNILAIEYLKALIRRHSTITPYLIKREGAGYHDTEIYSATKVHAQNNASAHVQAQGNTRHIDALSKVNAPTASATAIRNLLLTGKNFPVQHTAQLSASQTTTLSQTAQSEASQNNLPSELSHTMPVAAQQILTDYLCQSPALSADDFSQILGYRLLTATPESLADICDCNADIAHRIYRNRQNFYSYERFLEQNKSKDVTYTRISRVLLHLLLSMDKEKEAAGKDCDYIPYLRVLGFCKNTRDCIALLTTLKQTAKVPLITKLADAKNRLPAQALAMLEDDIFSCTLYEQVKFQKQQQNPATYSETAVFQNEYTRGLILL